MRRSYCWSIAFAIMAGTGCVRLAAVDAPYRPVPEIPALLWYTDFDESADVAKKLFEKGTIKSGKPNPDNDPMIALGPAGGDNKEVEVFIKLNTTPARFPDKLNPNQVYIQFNIWSSEPGKVEVWLRSGVDVNDWLTVPKPNTWCPMKVAIGTLSNKGNRVKPDSICNEIHLKFKPTRNDKMPEVYVDKFLVCNQLPPERVSMMLMAWQAKMGQLSKSVQADGFCYDDKMHTTMQKLKQQANHRGPALLFMPLPAAKADPEAAWNAAALEAKMRGVKFEVAQDPRRLPIAGLEDTRAFLPYILDKTDAQAALVVIPKEEALRVGKDIESLRLIFTRLQNVHCAPFVCLPAAEDGNNKLKEFLTASIKLCDELGVPYADQGFAFKEVKAPYANGSLTAEGEKALCALLVPAYKHIQDALNPRR